MSFTPTMRLFLTEEQEAWFALQNLTPQEALDKKIAEVKGLDFSRGTINFRDDVRFQDDGSVGRFSGAIVSWFIKKDEFHIKTDSGDVITLSYAYCRPKA